MIEVYASPTANCQRVTIALAMLGVEHRVITVDRAAGEQRSAAFLAINPAAAVAGHHRPRPRAGGTGGAGAVGGDPGVSSGEDRPAAAARRGCARGTFQWLMQALTDANAARRRWCSWRGTESFPAQGRRCRASSMRGSRDFLGDADHALVARDWLAGEMSIADLALYPVVAHRFVDAQVATRHRTWRHGRGASRHGRRWRRSCRWRRDTLPQRSMMAHAGPIDPMGAMR